VDGGFIDLRGNRDTGAGTDSFWPSFTDIMMVVVMIFMIASTMLMLRNWDLVQELRTTLEAEREAEEQAREAEQLARSMFETSATLEEQLAQAQHANSELRIQLMRANEENRSLRAQVSLHEQQLTLLQSEQQQLTASLQQSRRDARLQADQLQQAQAQYEQLTTARDTLQQRLQQVLAELEQSEASRQQEAVELDTLRQNSMLSVQQLASLQGEYDELRVKYDKLVKPARSAKGKYMVSVRYWKEGEYYQIRIKKMEETAYRTVSSKELHQELSQLKQQYPGSLYVKLIIPDDSGLSYNEAWGFTMDVLEKYDYYHHDGRFLLLIMFRPLGRVHFLCSAKENEPKERRTRRFAPRHTFGEPWGSLRSSEIPARAQLADLAALASDSNRGRACPGFSCGARLHQRDQKQLVPIPRALPSTAGQACEADL
jgi:hypothetical protein